MTAMRQKDFEHFAHGARYGDPHDWTDHAKETLLWYKASFRGKRDLEIDWTLLRNTRKRHPERHMIDAIENKLNDCSEGKLKLQVYTSRSPCSDPGDYKAMCAYKLVKFYENLKDRKIHLDAKIRISNFYEVNSVHNPQSKHWEGLKKLAKCDGFTLEVFEGEDHWKIFFTDVGVPDICTALTKKRKRRIGGQ